MGSFGILVSSTQSYRTGLAGLEAVHGNPCSGILGGVSGGVWRFYPLLALPYLLS